MSFGRNPHVPKALAAEQKAAAALDRHARELAYREAGHQWDRAAERENPGKKRTEYEQNAERNRALADAGGEASEPSAHGPQGSVVAPRNKDLLN
jgi:hypothetical protein